MTSWPVVGILPYDERRAGPVTLGSEEGGERSKGTNAVSGSREGMEKRRWFGDQRGAARRAPRYHGLQSANDVV